MNLVEGSLVAERFRLVRELGRGGMGSVWLAEHIGLETLCAIKFIDKDGQNSPEMRQRFEREARAAAQLKSPHVVQVHDHGVWDGIPYIAMEYLEGEDLAHRLERLGRLSRAETCRIVTQIGRALTKAHAAGIVHRDLKPENIFIVRDEDVEVAKVLDFGIAKRVRTTIEDNSTKAGSLLGTPFYMSPEQARGTRDVDHRSDLWALGVIAYQCVTGQVPFSSEGLGDILAQIMFEPLPVPSKRAPGVSASFDAWWARACARPVEERFQTARELSDALIATLGISSTFDGPDISFEIDEDDTTGARFTPFGSAREMEQTTMVGDSPGASPSGNTDNPFSLTYQPGIAEARSRRRRVALLGSAAALASIGLLVFALRGRHGKAGAESAGAAAGGVAAAMNVQAPPPSAPLAELVQKADDDLAASDAPHASAKPSESAAPHGSAASTPHATSHAPKTPAPQPPAPPHKRMDFGI